MAEYQQSQPQQLSQAPEPSVQSADDLSSSNKRKSGEDGPQQRSKRNRYISIACNECKRRKIKCNGEHPCQRCGNLGLECVYAPNCCSNNFKETQEYKQMNAQVESLQEQVNVLWQSLNTLRSSLGHEPIPQQDVLTYGGDMSRSIQPPQANMIIDPVLNRNQSSPQQNKYQGPTSSQYNFDLARSSLHTMGIATEEEGVAANNSHVRPAPLEPQIVPLHPTILPMTELTKDEALRLCRLYENEIGLMHPILDMKRVQQHAKLMFALAEAVRGTENSAISTNNELQIDADMEILKLVLANALVTESGGRSSLAKRFFESTARGTELGLQGDVSLKNIQIMTLVAMYFFHSDQETRSWRVIGIAARLCVELGLHRSETYTSLFATDDERDAALCVFWSVYVLDKRWSLGTGMASALSDGDIDPRLEKPYQSSAYLSCMVDYSKIGSKVWSSFGVKDSIKGDFSKGDAEYLNYQVLEWYKSVPSFLQYTGPKHADYADARPIPHDQPPHSTSRALFRLQLILYLRANQMRILIYRPVLHSAMLILSKDTAHIAQKVVDLSKDSIRTLMRISQTSDIYLTQQNTFNYFLISALAVLFLAVSHAPAQFAASCRDEFYMALELVRGLSSHSQVSGRLWRTIKGLKEIGPKLGLYQSYPEAERSNAISNYPRNGQYANDTAQSQNDAASSAAMAMAGLRAGRPVPESDFFSSQQALSPGTSRISDLESRNNEDIATSPNGMANDLMSLFEAAGAFANGSNNSGNTYLLDDRPSAPNVRSPPGIGLGMAGGHEEDFGRIMRDLF